MIEIETNTNSADGRGNKTQVFLAGILSNHDPIGSKYACPLLERAAARSK